MPSKKSASPRPTHRSATGKHYLLEARQYDFIHPRSPLEEESVTWSLARGTVFWRIWPAVLFHTLFATILCIISMETRWDLRIANSLLIVMGVVIGFVIAYRASSGYDRYTQGRAMWGDVIKNARLISRLIWIHLPSKMSSSGDATDEDIKLAISEKKAALGLVEAFAVALKHHLRNEMGIYYADLYPLLLPVHKGLDLDPQSPTVVDTESLVVTPMAHSPTFPVPKGGIKKRPRYQEASRVSGAGPSNGYGAIPGTEREDAPLLPSNVHHTDTTAEAVSTKYIPFWAVFEWLWCIISFRSFRKLEEVEEDLSQPGAKAGFSHRHGKHRPKVAGGGANLPLLIVDALGEWMATLDNRGTGGSALGGMMGCLQGFEGDLTDLERLLTTPLPIIYAAHLRTVWIYLFFLPFQLIDPLGYLTILAVAIAAFLYLGFLAAAEEIEQPFGYEENDLDLDFFIREIIHVDIEALLARPTPNSHHCKPDETAEVSHGAIADVCKLHHSIKAVHAEANGTDHTDHESGSTLQIPKKEDTQSTSALPPQIAVTVQQQPQAPTTSSNTTSQMSSAMRPTVMPTPVPSSMPPAGPSK